MDAVTIRLVQKYTEKGISDCKMALDECDGDELQAIKLLIDETTLKRLKNDAISRQIVPNSLHGSPSPEEERVLAFLQSS